MKKITLIIFLFIILVSISACKKDTTSLNTTTEANETTTVEIDEFKEDMLEYRLSKDLDFYYVSSAYETNIEELEIPTFHNNLPVRYIERFEKFYNLKKMIIPETIYGIDSSIYSFCNNFEYNEYNDGLYLGTKDNPYFYFYKPKSVKSETITIHNDTKIIGNECFLNNTKLRTINLPDGLKRIGYSAFMSALNITNISLPDSIEFIDVQAFSYCKALTNITIPKHIKIISEASFVNCNSLNSVTLNDEVETIMLGAFQGCTALSTITIPASIKNLYDKAFYDCTKLYTLYIDSESALNANSNSSIYDYARDLYVKDGLELNDYLNTLFKLDESIIIDGYTHYKTIK